MTHDEITGPSEAKRCPGRAHCFLDGLTLLMVTTI